MAETDLNSKPAPLEPSELGTREYWDALYETELHNHAADPSDTGTNWFDDSGAQDRVLRYLAERFPPSSSSFPDKKDVKEEKGKGEEGKGEGGAISFLDLGTGNGQLLFGLRRRGWGGRMLGVDYSARSVEFARRIEEGRRGRLGMVRSGGGDAEGGGRENSDADDDELDDDEVEEEEEGRNESREPVEFAQHDILSASAPILTGAQSHGWDVVLDKGTFDAISLSSATDERGRRRIGEGYRGSVLRLVRDGGLFLITSCNWTEDELVRWFTGEGEGLVGVEEDGEEESGRFEVADRIAYRSFSFGGVKGQTVSSVCFRKIGKIEGQGGRG